MNPPGNLAPLETMKPDPVVTDEAPPGGLAPADAASPPPPILPQTVVEVNAPASDNNFIGPQNTDGQPPSATPVLTGTIPQPDLTSAELLPVTGAPGPVNQVPSEPEDSGDCETECFIIYATVFVYFPPVASSNTDCLTKLLPQPTPTLPPGLQPEPGSAYVVVPQLSAGNNCTKITDYTSLTFTFNPGELSTIQGPQNITKEFNFADMPCPPPDVAEDGKWFFNPDVNPAQPYRPVVAPFSQLWNMNPAFKDCVVPLNQGFDPSYALPTAQGPTLPDKDKHRLGPGLGRLHGRGNPVIAHRVPNLPLKTAAPGSSGRMQN
ncbi:MAG: hypothetical protein Q9184_006625 [Pyrenodesmia sp. 2 TL-2023]